MPAIKTKEERGTYQILRNSEISEISFVSLIILFKIKSKKEYKIEAFSQSGLRVLDPTIQISPHGEIITHMERWKYLLHFSNMKFNQNKKAFSVIKLGNYCSKRKSV